MAHGTRKLAARLHREHAAKEIDDRLDAIEVELEVAPDLDTYERLIAERGELLKKAHP